jgi:hypothetical protein
VFVGLQRLCWRDSELLEPCSVRQHEPLAQRTYDGSAGHGWRLVWPVGNPDPQSFLEQQCLIRPGRFGSRIRPAQGVRGSLDACPHLPRPCLCRRRSHFWGSPRYVTGYTSHPVFVFTAPAPFYPALSFQEASLTFSFPPYKSRSAFVSKFSMDIWYCELVPASSSAFHEPRSLFPSGMQKAARTALIYLQSTTSNCGMEYRTSRTVFLLYLFYPGQRSQPCAS